MSVWLQLTALVVALQSSAAPQPIRLVDNGQARCEIVLPTEATPTEQRAADEVATYLKRMTTAEIPIVKERSAVASIAIMIGRTQRANPFLPEGLSQNDERIVVKSTPHGVVIRGGSDRGTLFAAYRFLEQLGCRWLTHDPADDIVPTKTTLNVAPLNIDSTPAFEWRFFRANFPHLEPWGLKLGMNGFYTADEARINGASSYLPKQADGVHTFSQLIPADLYFDKHPDWFVTQLGSPAKNKTQVGGQLCLTATGVVDEFTLRVRSLFESDPLCKIVSISPNDGYGWCTCERCRRLDKQLCGGREANMGTNRIEPFVGDRLFWFGNQVAEQISKTHPDRKLLMLAYVNYVEPPDAIVPASNIIPFVCHYAPADYSRAIADPQSKANQQFSELLQRWTKLSPNVMVYSYVSKSMWWNLPRPIMNTFAADIRHFHQLGIRRYYCQSRLTQWELDGPLYYVIAKMLWDPAAAPGQLADEWIAGMFGPAAAEMKTFYSCVEQSVKATGQAYSDDPPGQVPGLYDQHQLKLAMQALSRARGIASSDATARVRIEKVEREFHKGYWMIQSLEEDKLGPSGTRFGLVCCGLILSITASLIAWRRQSKAKSLNISATPIFWMLTTILIAFFAADRFFSLQHNAIDALRGFFESQSWYQRREIRQLVFLAALGSAGAATAFGFLWTSRRQFKRNLPAMFGLAVLCAFFVARATAFQRYDGPSQFRTFDANVREVCYGVSCEAFVQLISATCIAVAGFRAVGSTSQTDSSGTDGDPSKRDSPDDVDRPLRSE